MHRFGSVSGTAARWEPPPNPTEPNGGTSLVRLLRPDEGAAPAWVQCPTKELVEGGSHADSMERLGLGDLDRTLAEFDAASARK